MAWFITGIFLSLTCLVVWYNGYSKKHDPLPPGPPAEPLFGHLRLIPPVGQETLFYKWGKVYGNQFYSALNAVSCHPRLGDVVHLHFLGRSIIVLNSVKAAIDLLDDRGAKHSDRPAFHLFTQYVFVSRILWLQH
jgi:hypothetical protein